MNFKELRELITVCYALGDMNEEEYAILNETFTPRNLYLPYKSYGQFNLDEMDEDECLAELRVRFVSPCYVCGI